MQPYDSSSPILIRGTITRVEWRNPHTWIHLDVRTEDGRSSSRKIEIAGPSALTRRSIDRSLMSIGNTVTIEAWLSKNPGSVGPPPSGRTLILDDGRRLDVADRWGLEPR
jgi:hypothetical protein